MSEFSRWLTRKYPEYLLEQDTPMQQNAPAQSAAEILRQRQQKRAAEQGNVPTQQNQDAKAAAERLKQRMQQRQNAGNAGAGANAGGNAGTGTGGSVKDFMNDKNLDSNKA